MWQIMKDKPGTMPGLLPGAPMNTATSVSMRSGRPSVACRSSRGKDAVRHAPDTVAGNAELRRAA
jgi:hypothetical protein